MRTTSMIHWCARWSRAKSSSACVLAGAFPSVTFTPHHPTQHFHSSAKPSYSAVNPGLTTVKSCTTSCRPTCPSRTYPLLKSSHKQSLKSKTSRRELERAGRKLEVGEWVSSVGMASQWSGHVGLAAGWIWVRLVGKMMTGRETS
jgi:hypothetical protein